MPEPLLRITTSRTNTEAVIKLGGECDISNVEDLNSAVSGVLAAENRRIVLDVEELDFMGACGLMPIERAIESLQPTGGIVVIHKPARMLAWLLDFVGIA
jgi:anti-anti-sigma factor